MRARERERQPISGWRAGVLTRRACTYMPHAVHALLVAFRVGLIRRIVPGARSVLGCTLFGAHQPVHYWIGTPPPSPQTAIVWMPLRQSLCLFDRPARSKSLKTIRPARWNWNLHNSVSQSADSNLRASLDIDSMQRRIFVYVLYIAHIVCITYILIYSTYLHTADGTRSQDNAASCCACWSGESDVHSANVMTKSVSEIMRNVRILFFWSRFHTIWSLRTCIIFICMHIRWLLQMTMDCIQMHMNMQMLV